ncbi:hypothetical protein ABL78_2950 [Leptomonas seymouri]|uniref:PSP1 C-terminal domain-containing protein n=1 Tax=Leptomonas seymouri TaxID=5684 RepID=A0A0N0P6S6_LEPSE|nr:hypothetical protein ABL78_2950 [Leptomonas seymouri]|eukprot:KPI87959.1 hypothetical protein ABL78_2950 [Leptomonas seymouri]
MLPSTMTTASQLKATLTSNPQDSTEIPSLFHTFGHNDVSSGEDEDVEELEEQTTDVYHAVSYGSAAASGRRVGADGAHASRVGAAAAAAYPPAVPMLSTRIGAAASLNASRNRYPLNRSTRNPYTLLSSTDGTTPYGPEMPSLPLASSSMTGRPVRRYSFSSSTSQNPLTFEFNLSANGGETNVNNSISSASIAGGAGQRSQPLQQQQQQQKAQLLQQQHPTSEPADGYWRDGNPMSLPTTEVRLVATTTLGTLSADTSGVSQTINVNLRQRVRTPARSHANSLNTSQITVPAAQPVPSSAVGMAATAVAGLLPPLDNANLSVDASQLLHSFNDTARRAVNGNTTGTESHPPQQGSATLNANNRNHMISVPPSVAVDSEDSGEHCNPSVAGHQTDPSRRNQQQQQQYRQYQPRPLPVPTPQQQQQQQQSYFSYGGPNMSPSHSSCNHSSPPYSDQGYPGVPLHTNVYNATKAIPFLQQQQQQQQQQAQVPQQQQLQQYFDPHTQQQHIVVPQSAVNEYMNTYGQMPLNPSYYIGGAVAAGVGASTPGVPPMVQSYCYAAMPGVHSYGLAVPQMGYGGVEARTHHGGGMRSQQHQQLVYTVAGDAQVFSPPAQYVNAPANADNSSNSNKSRSTKDKALNASEGKFQSQGKQGGAKKVAATTSSQQLDGRLVASSDGNSNGRGNTSISNPVTGVSKKLPKKQDEARFHANRSATIQLFVVVKRKMEGQRYACPLPASEVPIGSQMLVEGDRGADLGEVLAHVSMEQMARDCILVERRRKAALEKMQEQKSGVAALSVVEDDRRCDAADEADVPQLTGQEARDYVMSIKDWPWLIGPATPEDVENLGPQREVEKQAFLTAKPIVQQFIENRYKQRVARNEQALRAAGNVGSAENDDSAAEKPMQDNSSDDGERRASLTEEELHTLELSRQVALVDCEYQFTREKITLFVSRPSRSIFVDFRRMQRRLYRIFRCRIWIAYMDEIADDEDAPESFVFVPPPSSSVAAAAPVADATESNQENV